MTITAKVIEDSVSDRGIRLTTLELRYPRFIHAEFMTHRVFSRNASSSRAIPVKRIIEDILADTAMPLHWGLNQPGMQAREEHEALIWAADPRQSWEVSGEFDISAHDNEGAWFGARDFAVHMARAFDEAGYHKQIVNRLLEPFAHINVVCTATEWSNFFLLRDHPDAQPEIQVLARAMKEAMDASVPRYLEEYDWHLPYVLEQERQVYALGIQKEVSAARCARVSYKTHDGRVPKLLEDVELFQRLAGSNPKHLSPTEHQATPCDAYFCNNFRGWRQFRKEIDQ